MFEKTKVSDIWENMFDRSDQARYEGENTLTGFVPFLVVACMGGGIADVLIRSVQRRWKQPWVVVVVLFVVGWVMMRFVQREGVRILVAGMYGRIGPASYESIVVPLYQKLGGDAKQLPALPKKQGKPGNAANCVGGIANDPLLIDAGTANDGMWQPPDMERDIRPLAQAMSANKQMLYDLSGEIFNEMQRREMVDPNAANETAEAFQTALQDVFKRMAS